MTCSPSLPHFMSVIFAVHSSQSLRSGDEFRHLEQSAQKLIDKMIEQKMIFIAKDVEPITEENSIPTDTSGLLPVVEEKTGS